MYVKNWDDTLFEYLKDLQNAKGYMIAAIEEGDIVLGCLYKVVKAIGVRKYARMVEMAPSNLLRAIDSNYNPTLLTLNKLIKPLGLKVGVVPIEPDKEVA